jgi:hypothetical protein
MKPVKNLPAAASDQISHCILVIGGALSKVPSTHIGSSSMWSRAVLACGWAGNSRSYVELGASFPRRPTVIKQFSRVRWQDARQSRRQCHKRRDEFPSRKGFFDAENYVDFGSSAAVSPLRWHVHYWAHRGLMSDLAQVG